MAPRRLRAPLALLFALAPAALVASDGRIEINQAKALAGGVTPGDTAGFPVTLSVAGSYILTSDLDVTVAASPQDVTAIFVTASAPGLDIDLNGFAIRGPASCGSTPPCTNAGSGYGIYSPIGGTSVRNGTVAGMGGSGVVVAGMVTGVHAMDNGDVGIEVAGLIADCIVESNGGFGVVGGAGSVERTTIRNNLGGGLWLNGGIARSLVIRDNTGGPAVKASGRIIDSVVTAAPPYPGPALDCIAGGGCVLSGSEFYGDDGAAVYFPGSNVTQLPAGSNLCGTVLCP